MAAADPFTVRKELQRQLAAIEEQIALGHGQNRMPDPGPGAVVGYEPMETKSPTPPQPPTDDQSMRPSLASEIETTMIANNDTIMALVDEIMRLRAILASEREDRFIFDQQVLKTLIRMRESGAVAFGTPKEPPHGSPRRW